MEETRFIGLWTGTKYSYESFPLIKIGKAMQRFLFAPVGSKMSMVCERDVTGTATDWKFTLNESNSEEKRWTECHFY